MFAPSSQWSSAETGEVDYYEYLLRACAAGDGRVIAPPVSSCRSWSSSVSSRLIDRYVLERRLPSCRRIPKFARVQHFRD
jgi:hypothetical protein